MRGRVGLILILLTGLSACSSLPVMNDNKVLNHVISIDRDGELNKIRLSNPPNQNLSIIDQTKAPYVFEHILNGIKKFPKNANNETEVLLYVHGGLNSKAVSLERAINSYQCITDDPTEPKYPIFINWETGPLQTYKSHLTRIRHGEASSFAAYTSPVYLLTDVASSLVNAPKSWLITGEHSWRSTVFRHRKKKDAYLKNYKSGDNGILYVGNGQRERLQRRAQWLATSPAKFITTPFTYSMAKPAWDVMLRRTNTLFFRDEDFDNGHASVSAQSGITTGSGALSVFLRELNKLAGQENLDLRITLVGHSMGAIVVNRILGMDHQGLIKNIVHMGSADSSRNLLNTVVPHLKKHAEANFYSLSLHPENEDREANMLGTVPSGSLLVWIDTMYTTPETVLDRRSGRWDNIKKVHSMIPESVRNRTHFKIYGLKSDNYKKNHCQLEYMTQPLQHGDFDSLEYWKKSTWWK